MSKLKGALPMIYTMYVATLFANKFLPKTIPRRIVDKETKKFTAAFSNTPGPLKPFIFENEKGDTFKCLSQQSYIIPAGYVGCGILCLSSQDGFKITIVSDDGVWSEQQTVRLCELIEKNLTDEIKRMEGKPLKESKKGK